MGDNPSDHDLLVAHSIQIDTLCKLMKSVDKRIAGYTDKLDSICMHKHGKIDDTHKDIFDKIDKKTDDTTFRWLIGILILLMITFAGTAATCLIHTGVNKETIVRIEKAIDPSDGGQHGRYDDP